MNPCFYIIQLLDGYSMYKKLYLITKTLTDKTSEKVMKE